jgi:tripartite-type tricarboxylate transporter receptor subunit TctC
VKEKIAAEGAQRMDSTPESFRAYIEKEIARWGQVVRDSGAKVD